MRRIRRARRHTAFTTAAYGAKAEHGLKPCLPLTLSTTALHTIMHTTLKSGVLFSALLAAFSAQALTAGDVAFVAYNTDGDDNFAWVALTDIAAGTSIQFTDSSWQAGAFRSTEHLSAGGPLTWSHGSAVAAGTVVQYNGKTPNSWSLGTAARSAVDLASGGDQLFAFEGSTAAPVFVAGAQFAHAAGIVASPTVSNSTNTTNVPTALTLGSTMVDVGNFDNAYYIGPTTGSRLQLLTAMGDVNNWTRNDAGPLASTNWVAGLTVTPVPEPSSYALLLAGLAVVGRLVRRQRV